jgi:RNase H-fold protein (predicted Holliday junction resolvase)
VVAFKERLAKAAATTVVTWDERYTSKLAEGSSRKSGEQDSVAACYILQDYLDWRSRGRGD